jgi:hypothetical protein
MSEWAETAIARRLNIALRARRAAPLVRYQKRVTFSPRRSMKLTTVFNQPSQSADRPARGPIRSQQPRRRVVRRTKEAIKPRGTYAHLPCLRRSRGQGPLGTLQFRFQSTLGPEEVEIQVAYCGLCQLGPSSIPEIL